MSTETDREKLATAVHLMNRDAGNSRWVSVYMHLDPRLEGVVIPSYLKERDQVVLQFGIDMPVPIPDMNLDENGFYGTLQFSNLVHTCFVPWYAVFALVNDAGNGRVWESDMPHTVTNDTKKPAPVLPLTTKPAGPRVERDKLAPVVSLADFRSKRSRGAW